MLIQAKIEVYNDGKTSGQLVSPNMINHHQASLYVHYFSN